MKLLQDGIVLVMSDELSPQRVFSAVFEGERPAVSASRSITYHSFRLLGQPIA